MTDGVTAWNVTRIGSAIYDKIDAVLGGANIVFGGVVSAEGFGGHSFSSGGTGANTIDIRNTTSGTGNFAGVRIGNNSTSALGALFGFSSTYTTSGRYVASGLTIESNGAGGLQLSASDASGPIRMYTGGTQRLAIDSVGVLTPLNSLKMHSGFLAYNSATDAGVTNGSTVDFDTEVYDEGSHFSGDTFTAPETGRYVLSAAVTVQNLTGGTIDMGAKIVTSNETSGYVIGSDSALNNTQCTFAGSVIVDMDSGDTATVQYYGSGNASVIGFSTTKFTWFCGRRVL